MLDRLRRSEDDGFTLVELLVVMLITGIVLAMVGTMFANIARLTNWSGTNRNVNGQSALAIDAIRSVVRVAAQIPNPSAANGLDPAICLAGDSVFKVTAYSNTDAKAATPVLVQFQLRSGYLWQTRYPQTPSGAGCAGFSSTPTSDTRIAGPFDANATPKFFTYISSSNAVLTLGAGTTNPTVLNTIVLVRVSATTADSDSTGAASTNLVQSSIGMPNVNIDVASSISIPTIPPPTQTPSATPSPSKSSTSTPTTSPSSSPPSSSTPSASPTGSGSGSGSGTGNGTATPRPTGSGGSGTPHPTGGTGGGTSTTSSTPKPTTTTSTPKPTTSSPKPTSSTSSSPPTVFQ